jgi:hypothetical protein
MCQRLGGVDITLTHDRSLLKLDGGTFTLHHPNGHETAKLHKRTCLVDGIGRGKYPFGGGTGDYAGITGRGRYLETFKAVLAKTTSGAFDQSGEPVAFQLTIVAHGAATRA